MFNGPWVVSPPINSQPCASAKSHKPLEKPASQCSSIEGNAKAKGNLDVAEAYLKFLYTPEGQKLAAKNFFRPVDPSAADPADLARFPKVELVSIDKDFGGWSKAQKEFFADGAIFDQIYRPTN